MDYTDAALSYGLLLLPTCFALAIIGQSIYKIQKGESNGKIILLFGLVLLLLIPLTYFFVIRI